MTEAVLTEAVAEMPPGHNLKSQMVQGGDLYAAIKGIHTPPVLNWYKNGAQIALDIINGLRFLHSHNVSLSLNHTCLICGSARHRSCCRLPCESHAGRLPPAQHCSL